MQAYQNTDDILHRTREEINGIHMEPQKSSNSKTILSNRQQAALHYLI